MKWISSTGGPLVLLPSSIRKQWSGWVRIPSSSISDYDAACAVRGYAGVIERYGCPILVLNDEPMDTTTIQMGPAHVVFARWMYGPSREIVENVLRRLRLNAARELQRLAFTAPEQSYCLTDSAELGVKMVGEDRIEIVPGDYVVRILEHAPRKDTKLILYEVLPSPGHRA